MAVWLQIARLGLDGWLDSHARRSTALFGLFWFGFSTGTHFKQLLRFVFRFVLSHFERPVLCFQSLLRFVFRFVLSHFERPVLCFQSLLRFVLVKMHLFVPFCRISRAELSIKFLFSIDCSIRSPLVT